jgi:hypothetical protein
MLADRAMAINTSRNAAGVALEARLARRGRSSLLAFQPHQETRCVALSGEQPQSSDGSSHPTA